MAWYQGLSEFTTRRPLRGRHVRHQSPRPSHRRELRRMGWHVLNLRLRRKRCTAKRRHVECHHFRVFDGWMSRRTKWSKIGTRVSCSMWYSFECLRGCWCACVTGIQRQHTASATAATGGHAITPGIIVCKAVVGYLSRWTSPSLTWRPRFGTMGPFLFSNIPAPVHSFCYANSWDPLC